MVRRPLERRTPLRTPSEESVDSPSQVTWPFQSRCRYVYLAEVLDGWMGQGQPGRAYLPPTCRDEQTSLTHRFGTLSPTKENYPKPSSSKIYLKDIMLPYLHSKHLGACDNARALWNVEWNS